MAIKYDTVKAFNTMDWDFSLNMLAAFGFSNIFVSWIKMILESARLSVLVNGTPHGFFPCSRGVCLGDPLSPLLFCLAEDVLSKGTVKLRQNALLNYISSLGVTAASFYMFYADDLISFCRANKKGITNLLELMEQYGQASRQIVSMEKSNILLGRSIVRRQATVT